MKKSELLINLLFFPGLILIGIFFVLLTSSTKKYILLATILSGLGFVLFAKAKWSRIGEGKWTEFGYSQMNSFNKTIYLFGYVLMLIGIFIACV